MKSPIEYLRSEKAALRREWPSLIAPLLVLITFLYLLAFRSGDWTAKASQELTFQPRFPEAEYMIPWKVDRLAFRGSAYQNEVVNYANAIGGKDFTLTLVSENGTLEPMRRSEFIQRNGKREPSYGLCQLHMAWHSAFINSPGFKDWRKQAMYCLKVFKTRPGAFYGYYVRSRALKSFL